MSILLTFRLLEGNAGVQISSRVLSQLFSDFLANKRRSEAAWKAEQLAAFAKMGHLMLPV